MPARWRAASLRGIAAGLWRRRRSDGGADIHLRTRYKPLAQAPTGKTRSRGLNLDVTAASGFTAFLFAVRAGAIDSALGLLKAGASVDERLGDGTSALVLAIGSTRYDLAALLVDQGADISAAAQGWTPLHQIVWTRRPNTGSNNPWPVERDRIDSLSFARRLLERGADVNAPITRDADISVIGRRRYSDVGATPLWIASQTLDLPMMRLLVAHGADIDRPNGIGTTPLLAAAGVGIEMPGENPGSPSLVSEAVSFLLARGADAMRVDRPGETALHGAALWGSDDAVRRLAQAGARLDAVNECGWLPWHVATGVAYDGNVIGQHPATADLLRRMMEERGAWKTPPPAAPC